MVFNVHDTDVTLDRAIGNRWLVTSGLKAGDLLIVEGLQRAKVGAVVQTVPAGTRELAVILEDPDAGNPPPFVHWLVYKIPPTARGLPENIPIDPADSMSTMG